MFLMDRKLLQSFPRELIDQLSSKKVFSMMLSMPMFKNEDAVSGDTVDEEISPDPAEYMGIVEQRLSTIVYGNSDPLNPSPDS